MRSTVLFILGLTLVGCGPTTDLDGGGTDSGAPDAGMDAPSMLDAGADVGLDAGDLDAGEPDAGERDAGEADAGEPDVGLPDAPTDAGPPTFDPGASTTLPTPSTSGDFGYAIAVSADGMLLAIGDPDAGAMQYGAVYLYARGATGFGTTPFQTLSGRVDRTQFGASVAFMPESHALAVGDFSAGPGRPGTVDLFAYTAPSYATTAYQTILPASASTYALGLAFSPDGDTLAIGDPGLGANGVVHLHSRESGVRFEAAPDQTLVVPGASLGRFGTSVVFTPDGTTLVVGDDGTIATGGTIYGFAFAGGLAATAPTSTLTGPPGTREFGASIALSPDGATLAVGAPSSTPIAMTGVVYLYRFPGGFTPYQTITHVDGERFGRGLAFTPDLSTLIVGDRSAGTAMEGAVFFLPR